MKLCFEHQHDLLDCLRRENKMIDEDWRYFTYAGAITPGGPSRWDILDWDQRRTISVNMSTEEHDGNVAIGMTH